jgi:hypothetical protein
MAPRFFPVHYAGIPKTIYGIKSALTAMVVFFFFAPRCVLPLSSLSPSISLVVSSYHNQPTKGADHLSLFTGVLTFKVPCNTELAVLCSCLCVCNIVFVMPYRLLDFEFVHFPRTRLLRCASLQRESLSTQRCTISRQAQSYGCGGCDLLPLVK